MTDLDLAEPPHRVLFVSHDASRTGAPILLLEAIRWMQANRGVQPVVLLLRDGPLAGAFAELGPTVAVDHTDRRTPGQIVEASLRQLGRGGWAGRVSARRRARALRRLGPVDAVWLSAAPSVLAVDPATVAPIAVAHIHELEGVLDEALDDRRAFDRNLAACAHIVVGAEEVADNLVAAHGVHRGRVAVRAEFIADPPPGDAPAAEVRASGLRARLGIPADAHVIGACGTASWRKGMDQFTPLAVELARSGDDETHLVWVGGRPGERAFDDARSDVHIAGLDHRVHFVGEQTDLDPWFALFDVFVLPSREDSFPLVCLLAGRRGTPVVAFDTGMGELLRRAGADESAIPDLDLDRLARRIAVLLGDDGLRADEGGRLSREVRAHHLTSTAAESLWLDLATAAGWR